MTKLACTVQHIHSKDEASYLDKHFYGYRLPAKEKEADSFLLIFAFSLHRPVHA